MFQINLVSKGKLTCMTQQDGKWLLSAALVIIQPKFLKGTLNLQGHRWAEKGSVRAGLAQEVENGGLSACGPGLRRARNHGHLSTCPYPKGAEAVIGFTVHSLKLQIFIGCLL